MVAWLRDEMRLATVADLQRAASFLQFAREVRRGSTKKRTLARQMQQNGWRKHVDSPLMW